MEVLGGLLICGVALVPLAALVLLLNVWQRVQRLEETVRAMRGQPADGASGTMPAAPAMPSSPTTPQTAAPSPGLSAPPTATVPAAPAVVAASPVASAPRRSRGGVERALGARLPIWIGSIAVALAGIYLFKFAIDEGYFGPLARVIVGGIAGLVLLGAAERLRQRSRSVAGGLAAAGIAVLYASIVAATNLYGLIGPVAGGVGMAAVTAAAVALSLRFGPVVVVIGLIGGFLTPALIGAVEPSPWRLFGYLALLQLGVLAVGRRRNWWWLGPVMLFGGGVWSILWLLDGAYDPADGLPLGLFVLFGAVAVIGAANGNPRGGQARDDEERAPRRAARRRSTGRSTGRWVASPTSRLAHPLRHRPHAGGSTRPSRPAGWASFMPGRCCR